jgi:hypothetical protein
MPRTRSLLLAALLWTGPVHGQGASPQQSAPQPPRPGEPAGPGAQKTTPPPENLVTFDYRRAEVRWMDQRWQLLADGVWLKDFGRREADARDALRTIQSLRLTQRGTVGTPAPVMEYWLSDGQAPGRIAAAGRIQKLDLPSLRVEAVRGQWCLRDNGRIWFVFGPQREGADQALAVIRRYGFTHVGTIGQLTTPSMTYFLGGEDSNPHALTPAGAKPGPIVPHPPVAPDPADASRAQHPGAISPAPAPAGRHPVGETRGAATPPSPPVRLAFDFRQVQVRRDGADWKLTFGSHVFANFGDDQLAAKQAQSLFQHYRFTEQFLIGRPVLTFSYFLVAGQAPRGLKFGVLTEAFRPEAVVVRQVGNQWTVCEGDRPLVSCGDQQKDARQIVQAIQRYHFDHLCRVGNDPGHSLTFLVRER